MPLSSMRFFVAQLLLEDTRKHQIDKLRGREGCEWILHPLRNEQCIGCLAELITISTPMTFSTMAR